MSKQKHTNKIIKDILSVISSRESAYATSNNYVIPLDTPETDNAVHDELNNLLADARNAIILDRYKSSLEVWVKNAKWKLDGEVMSQIVPDYLLLKYDGSIEEVEFDEFEDFDEFLVRCRKRGFLLKV